MAVCSEGFCEALLDNLADGVYLVDRENRIGYWNKAAERITGYSAAEAMGRACSDNMLNHVDASGKQLCVVGCPLKETLCDGVTRSVEVFLHHRDGHRIPVLVRAAPIHGPGGEITGAVEVFTDLSDTQTFQERIRSLESLVYVDQLTGLANRRYTEISIHSRFEELRRYGWPFGVIMMDIDHFKLINEGNGHLVGDNVLRMVSATLSKATRPYDVTGRWGGEEFLSVVTNVSAEELREIAERFRVLVSGSSLSIEKESLMVTISAGATLARPDDSRDSLIARADELLYRAKVDGRNILVYE